MGSNSWLHRLYLCESMSFVEGLLEDTRVLVINYIFQPFLSYQVKSSPPKNVFPFLHFFHFEETSGIPTFQRFFEPVTPYVSGGRSKGESVAWRGGLRIRSPGFDTRPDHQLDL